MNPIDKMHQGEYSKLNELNMDENPITDKDVESVLGGEYQNLKLMKLMSLTYPNRRNYFSRHLPECDY